MLRRVEGQLLSRNVEKDDHNVVVVGGDNEDDDRAPQFVESCDPGLENMDQNKRIWTYEI